MTTYDYLARLDITWSISRGRETYGYNICRLDDAHTGKRYRCSGGGYDMVGTVLADYLQDVFQSELLKISKRAASSYNSKTRKTKRNEKNRLYGMTFYPVENKVVIDGACGISTVIEIARAIGLSTEKTYRKNTLIGFIVSHEGK